MIAHAGHWLVNALYAVPVAIVGVVLWRASRRERGEDDAETWDDPRLRDLDDV